MRIEEELFVFVGDIFVGDDGGDTVKRQELQHGNTVKLGEVGRNDDLLGSLGDGMQLIVGILSIPDTALTGWGVQLTVSEGETDTGLLRIRALKRPTTTEEGLPGYGGEVYIGVGNPEIVMEYEHEMDTDHRHRRRFPGMVHRAGRPQGLFDHSAR